jgi:hypothetical protein
LAAFCKPEFEIVLLDMYPDLVSTESNAKAEPESEIIIGSQCLAIISEMESAYSMTSANAQDYWYADSGATEHMSDRLSTCLATGPPARRKT